MKETFTTPKKLPDVPISYVVSSIVKSSVRETVVKPVLKNALDPILVTKSGIAMVVKLVPANA